MNLNNNEKYEEIIAYCPYCKDPVLESDDSHKKNGDIYHAKCWEQKYGIREELNFDE